MEKGARRTIPDQQPLLELTQSRTLKVLEDVLSDLRRWRSYEILYAPHQRLTTKLRCSSRIRVRMLDGLFMLLLLSIIMAIAYVPSKSKVDSVLSCIT